MPKGNFTKIEVSALGYFKFVDIDISDEVNVRLSIDEFREFLFFKSMFPSNCSTDPAGSTLPRRTSNCLSKDMQTLWHTVNAIDIDCRVL